jgi:integrase
VTEEQLGRLLAAAETGETIRGTTGKERALLYRVCLITGFRANEIRSIKVRDVILDGTEPGIQLRRSSAKNKKDAFQLVTPAIADMLRRHIFGKNPGDPLFYVPGKTATMLRVDLDAAGIPYVEDGKFFDFHCLRYECGSLMVSKGVSLSVVQKIMRHANISMTNRYIRSQASHEHAAVKAIGDIVAAPDSARQQNSRIA